MGCKRTITSRRQALACAHFDGQLSARSLVRQPVCAKRAKAFVLRRTVGRETHNVDRAVVPLQVSHVVNLGLDGDAVRASALASLDLRRLGGRLGGRRGHFRHYRLRQQPPYLEGVAAKQAQIQTHNG